MHYERVRAVWETGHNGCVSTDMRTHYADGRIMFLGCQADFTFFHDSLDYGIMLRNAPWYGLFYIRLKDIISVQFYAGPTSDGEKKCNGMDLMGWKRYE